MKKVQWVNANPRLMEQWDQLVDKSVNGTLFHSRRFLSYHGARFKGNERFLVALKIDQPIALLPLGLFLTEHGKIARSPYAASYGGIIFLRPPTYSEASRVITAFIDWLRSEGIQQCVITQSPDIFHDRNISTAIFGYHEQGFRLTSRDVCSVVNTASKSDIKGRMKGNARNKVRKAENAGVIVDTTASLEELWPVVEETFERHGTRPTHSYEELADLLNRCPQDIRIVIARLDKRPVAGIVEFRITNYVNSSFYFCQNSVGAEVQALSLLVDFSIHRAQVEGYKLYDFGTSTVKMNARPNIFRFKEGFGAEGIFRETMEWAAE